MKSLILVFLTLLLSSVGFSQHNLIPQPLHVKEGNGNFKISKKTIVTLKDGSIELNNYVNRFIVRLRDRSNVFLNQITYQDTLSENCIEIKVKSNIDTLFLGVDESYSLDIKSGKIVLNAANNVGAYRGLETLLQLLSKNALGAYLPSIHIEDKPRFPWRGLMIDVCRHWIPKHVIKRNIDAMAAVKLNVLHLHLTDDQGFRIESKTYPKLHEKGSNGTYFTQLDIQEIVSYAKERGIRVIPEFDIPGHATSWVTGYPDLASLKGPYEIEKNYGVFNPTLNPTKEETYYFLEQFLGEMAKLFPDEYIHIGGDENNGKQWDQNSKIEKFMEENNLADNHALQAYFNSRLLDILKKNNKKMMGWDEIHQPSIAKEIVIQSWRGKESLYQFANQGYPGLLSNGFYLDKVYDAKNYYENDPLPSDTTLSSEAVENILGGEATMWSELVNQKTIDSRIWPASIAIAERLWSSSENCNTKELYRKLPIISTQLEEHGLMHINYQAPLLREMSGMQNISGIQVYVQLLEPLKGYKRHRFLKYKTTYPLNRLVDACYTESFRSLHLEELIQKNCANKGQCTNRSEIKLLLKQWIKSNEAFLSAAENSTALKEAKPLALLTLELLELSFLKINSPSEFNNDQTDRAISLIEQINLFNLDCNFAPTQALALLF